MTCVIRVLQQIVQFILLHALLGLALVEQPCDIAGSVISANCVLEHRPFEGPESSLTMLVELENARAYTSFFDYLTGTFLGITVTTTCPRLAVMTLTPVEPGAAISASTTEGGTPLGSIF